MPDALRQGMPGVSERELLVILSRARKTLSDPSHFSGRYFAEDASGRWCPVGASQAVRFNLEGALVHAAGTDARDALSALFEIFAVASPTLSERLKHRAVAPLMHDEALAMLDDAIAHVTLATARSRSGTRMKAVTDEELARAVAKPRRG